VYVVIIKVEFINNRGAQKKQKKCLPPSLFQNIVMLWQFAHLDCPNMKIWKIKNGPNRRWPAKIGRIPHLVNNGRNEERKFINYILLGEWELEISKWPNDDSVGIGSSGGGNEKTIHQPIWRFNKVHWMGGGGRDWMMIRERGGGEGIFCLWVRMYDAWWLMNE
jgi:hypothetical protein